VMWTGLVWLRIGTGELCIESSDCITCWESMECPNNWGSLE
jgi:hypothetical protein